VLRVQPREVAVTKSEFIEKVSGKTGLSKKDAGAAVEAFMDVVKESLAAGEDIQFTGFGKFYVQDRQAREGINPQTKKKIKIAATKVPKFSPGAALKSSLK
jgi:DNA-binding protein HU-beta